MTFSSHACRSTLAFALALFPATYMQEAMAASSYASEVPADVAVVDKSGSSLATDGGNATIPVAEELDFVRTNNFRTPFDDKLKHVAKVDYFGTRYVGCEHYRLETHLTRPNRMAVRIDTGDGKAFEIENSGSGIISRGEPQGVGDAEQRALVQVFEFDPPRNRLEANANAYKPLGMQKVGGSLAWKLESIPAGAYRTVLYVDSHFGDVLKYRIVDAKGAVVLDVMEHDYRTVDGIRVPFAIDYVGPDGQTVASDRIERAVVTPSGA